jgi:hypothetical protein
MRRSLLVFVVSVVVVALSAGAATANTTVITWTHDDLTFRVRDCGFRVEFHAFGPYKIAD